jgi:hypothetical protein
MREKQIGREVEKRVCMTEREREKRGAVVQYLSDGFLDLVHADDRALGDVCAA